jgi:hypothetical protein
MQPRNGSPLDNPAFTIRRHLLQAKEDNIQIEQMKRVIRKQKNKKEIIEFLCFV